MKRPPIEPGKLYYIQDTRQVVGNCVLWWGKKSAGYTCELSQAGTYDADEARVICRRGTDIAWEKDMVDSLVVRHVRNEPLRRILHD